MRGVTTLVHELIHKIIDVYVEDMIIKSTEDELHHENLRIVFERFREYNMWLNPMKCTFGVTAGKLLGFMVSRRGIEIDPTKVKSIDEMEPPHNQKEVRGYLERLNYISRFISQITATCEPIFRLLRKNNPGAWDEQCQIEFDKIKRYLKNPPLLVPPIENRPLLLYLTVLENSLGAVLAQHDESSKREQAIYYLSKKFNECESRYSVLRKLVVLLRG